MLMVDDSFNVKKEELKQKDKIIYDLYVKLRNTKTPEKQRNLLRQIDTLLDERLKLKKSDHGKH